MSPSPLAFRTRSRSAQKDRTARPDGCLSGSQAGTENLPYRQRSREAATITSGLRPRTPAFQQASNQAVMVRGQYPEARPEPRQGKASPMFY